MTRKIVLCGGAGYVGSALVPELMSRGWDVTSIDLGWFGDHLPDGCVKVWGDAKDVKVEDLKDVECVVWLAGLSNDPMAGFDPSANFIENAAIPAYLCYLAKQAGVRRFVHGGSCSVYGNMPRSVLTEAHHPRPQFPYGIAKLQAETGCLPLVDDAFSVICLRKGTVSGYSPRMRFDLLINTMVKDALTRGVITVNNPAIGRPILAMRDAVDAYCVAIEASPSVSGVFNIVSENLSIGLTAEAVQHALAEHGVKVEIDRRWEIDPRDYQVSGDKAKQILGFSPKYYAEDVVDDIMEHDYGDMTDSNYYNIRRFKEIRE